jgi:tRNA 2-selenouridine synthase
MATTIQVDALIPASGEQIILDVRSPGEYQKGHIPGAISFPLFSDEERAAVGTLYKVNGPDAALQLGLQFVGPKMAGFVQDATALAPHKNLILHCWRGGNRSQSVAWLLRMAGFNVMTLEGGYKAYRNYVIGYFRQHLFNLRILGGKTGSGKTKILHALQEKGEQIIDLEGVAHHKGSAFGTIGEPPQPSSEQFENNLLLAVMHLDPEKPVWVENESRSIGKVFVPDGLWDQMKVAPMYQVEVPEEARIQNLLDDYAHTDRESLRNAFLKIDSKLGGQNLKTALEALDLDDYAAAARIALWYYDKTYQHGLDQNTFKEIHKFVFHTGHPAEIAQHLIALPCTTTPLD